MNSNKTKHIVYRTLLLYNEINEKYDVYNNSTYIIAYHRKHNNIIKLYASENKLPKTCIHNSESYNYYAIINKDVLYIINREKLITAFDLGDIPYTFNDYIVIEEDLLNALSAKTIRMHLEDITN